MQHAVTDIVPSWSLNPGPLTYNPALFQFSQRFNPLARDKRNDTCTCI